MWVIKPGGFLINNLAKSILIGQVSGILIGLTGEHWDFNLHNEKNDFEYFGTAQALIGGVLVMLSLFLLYNKKD